MRPWVGRIREFGIYDQLRVELCNEDHASFTHFLRMPPYMYNELLRRVDPKIIKTHTRCSELGLLALTLHHLAHVNKYASIMFAWRAHRTPFQ